MQIPPNPKILVVDIETAPMLASVWGLYDNVIGVSQIDKHSHLMSAAAKWVGSSKVMYKDQRSKKNVEDDKDLVVWLRSLLDEADIVVGQNSKRFDIRTINSRIEFHKLKTYSDFRHQDTKIIAKKALNLPSYSLAYMSEFFKLKYQKLTHKKFEGFTLWKECLKGNLKAWREMEVYNKHDVLATEELWKRLIKWDTSINFNVFYDDNENRCSCGSFVLVKWGYRFKNGGKYQRYSCTECGKPHIGKTNLLSEIKKKDMLK